MERLRQTQNFYNRLSRWYDWLSGPAERKISLQGVDLLALVPGERALEVGFGSGHALLKLAAQVGDGGAVFGLDLAPGMAAVAQARLRRCGKSAHVHLVCGDGLALPFPAECLNGVFLSFTLELFSDAERPRLLAECRRVLKPNGRLAVVALNQPARFQWGAALYTRLRRCFPEVIDCRPIHAAREIHRAGFELLTAQETLLLHFLPIARVAARKPSSG